MKKRLAYMKRLASLSVVVLVVLSVLATAPASGAQFDILVHPSLTPCVSPVPPVPIFATIQEANAVVDNGDTGIDLGETEDCTVRSNTASYNERRGIGTGSSLGTVVILNNVYRNTLQGIIVVDSRGGEKFICDTSHFNNVMKAPSVFDCEWESRLGAARSVARRCVLCRVTPALSFATRDSPKRDTPRPYLKS